MKTELNRCLNKGKHKLINQFLVPDVQSLILRKYRCLNVFFSVYLSVKRSNLKAVLLRTIIHIYFLQYFSRSHSEMSKSLRNMGSSGQPDQIQKCSAHSQTDEEELGDELKTQRRHRDIIKR